jgi:hypothetical protein
MTKVVISMVDGQGRKTSKEFDNTGTVAATIATDVTAFIADWIAISGLGTVAFNISFETQAVNASEGPTANKDEAARLQLLMTDGSQYNLRIPAPKKTTGVFNYITGGVVDTSNADLLAMLAHFEAAGTMRLNDKTLSPLPGSFLGGYLED